ncbi:hypothetical protein BC829DRAFT_387187 [Chytridium lagenaria]|nr:hypothetical protein BC829DRAFT_387187 [Chytridium lagenaria]
MSKKGRTIKAGRSKGVNGEGRRAGGDVARSQAVYFRDPASKPRNSKALAKQKELDQRLDKEKAERNLKKAAQIAKREDALEAAERAKSPYTHRLFNWLRKSAEGVAHQIVETISEILMPGPNQAQKRRASQESPAFEDFVSTPKNLRVNRILNYVN